MQITVDGLRGDLLSRYGARFGEGGFRLLLRNGAVFANSHYQHANTETIVGHATLATGANPSTHGMVGNVWYDRETGELSYNIEDPEHPLLPTRESDATGEQLDPAQRASRTLGRSPRSILASTFTDELATHFAGDAKIFAVSGKDRSSVAMAGHAGKAFWYSTNSGDFVTSSFYYRDYPDWVTTWNKQRLAASFAGKRWRLLKRPSTYLLAKQDDRPYETDLQGFGRTFPHPFGASRSKIFFTLVFISPYGDWLTNEFAKTLLVKEQLGKNKSIDYLSVSYSSVDAVNHFFGPSSLENEDAVLRLDGTLADLFAHVDKHVGLEHTLIVLSADHGMAEMPEYMAERGMDVSRLLSEDLVKLANAAGRASFGIDNIAKRFFRPYLYLDDKVLGEARLDRPAVERTIAEQLTAKRGIALAVASSSLATITDSPLVRKIRLNHHPKRSGDIYVVQEPYWFMYEKGPIAAMHGSPWSYDAFVPVIFFGPGINSRTIHRRTFPIDVAPTLAAYLGIKPPSSSVGTPLPEALP
ncbi:MAG: alkaline phosphatase family protein [Hyphomicrobiaceae bacterium]